jgi:hypothetical protein
MHNLTIRYFRVAIIVMILGSLLIQATGCSSGSGPVYFNPLMDFGAVKTVAILPFQNLSGNDKAADRVRDELMVRLLATEAIYVLPPGEVARGYSLAGVRNPSAPSIEEVKKLSNILKVDAVITGVLREYETVRAGQSSANLISLSLQMIETQTGQNVWTSSSTKGGVDIWDRLFGGGGQPMDTVTAEATRDLINKLFE